MGRDLVTVARFDIPAKAHIARNALEAVGIRSVIQDEQLVAMDYLLNLAVDGIKIQVWEEDAERALAILDGISHGRESAEDPEKSLDDVSESVQSAADSPQTANARDRYAGRAMWALACSLLIAPVSLYTGYLLMTMFSEGTLTGARRWGVWVAALVTPLLMLLIPVWAGGFITLITTGTLGS